MPITLAASVKYVVAPVRLNEDLSADVTLVGQLHYGTGNPPVDITRVDVHIPPADVATVLGQMPQPGLNRLDDLTIGIYQYLVAKGVAPTGEIS